MGIPGERDYSDSRDLVWDISKECTAWALRQRVASHYCLPVDKIEIAKYFPERFEWLPISSWVRSGMTEPNSCWRGARVGLGCSSLGVVFKENSKLFCFGFIQTQQISKRKRRKKQESLQSAPYHLKDGDIIGVKVNYLGFNCSCGLASDTVPLAGSSFLPGFLSSCCISEGTGMWVWTLC